MVFVDGENLLLRYEAMLARGCTKRNDNGHSFQAYCPTVHDPKRFVWNPAIPRSIGAGPLLRVSYYTTAVGDSDALELLESDIASQRSHFAAGTHGSYMLHGSVTSLVPKVFKKQKAGSKTKSVDINLCVDVLTQAYQSAVDDIVIVSGDGDYAPLIRQAMSAGKRVHVAALSDGLSPVMGRISDGFIDLDPVMFSKLV